MNVKQHYAVIGLLGVFLCLGFEGIVGAQDSPINSETITLANDIIAGIYHDIVDYSFQYEQLEDFGQESFYENPYGISAIVYEHSASTSDSWRPPYYFGVSITALEDDLFQDQTRYFEHVFPLLGIKMVGYEPKYLKRSQFSIKKAIETYVTQLLDYQQQYLPLRLTIEPAQEAFRIGEELVFDAVLTNVSKQHIYVKPLGPKTLYFLLNNAQWGTRPAEYIPGESSKILEKGKELRMRFTGKANYRSNAVTITGVYNAGYQGVKPYGRTTVRIIE